MSDITMLKSIIAQEQKIRQLSEEKRRAVTKDLQAVKMNLEKEQSEYKKLLTKCRALEECHIKNTEKLHIANRKLKEYEEQANGSNLEIQLMHDENKKLQQSLSRRHQDLKDANMKIIELNEKVKVLNRAIQTKDDKMEEMCRDHKQALAQASTLVEEYFKYKFLESPLDENESSDVDSDFSLEIYEDENANDMKQVCPDT